MCFCTIIYPVIIAPHERATVLKQCSHRRSVAVDEGTHYITLVYCDPASSLQVFIFMMMFSFAIIT